MSRFIESICFNEDYRLMDLHQERVERTFKEFFPGKGPLTLKDILPSVEARGKHKVRVVYDGYGHEVSVQAYQSPHIRSLRLVEGGEISYAYKSEDRNSLGSLFNQKEEADDVIILKNGLITDSLFANLIFWDGSLWYTPDSYLLNGVKRQYLLRQGLIHERRIAEKDIGAFSKVGLINALLDPGDVTLNIREIIQF